MATVNDGRPGAAGKARKRGRPTRAPSARNCAIYERVRLEGERQERVAADYAISRQRISDIVAQVENWIAAHATHELAIKMRVRCGKRWEALWSRSIDCFDRSRQDRQITKQRTLRRAADNGQENVLTTVSEQTLREQNGDPRFLNIAARVAEREDRYWMREEDEITNGKGRDNGRPMVAGMRNDAETAARNGTEAVAYQYGAAMRYPYLPAGLCDLEHLACGLSPGGVTPVSTLFEQRCAEAFRAMGFEVRELGQGLGRVADCLAVAAAERFAVVIDAKVRRRGYTLATDDRQFCEYATKHTHELAQSGIERVYFAVVGRGFRQEDLDKLAKFMTGTPIRGVVFIEAEALMRLVSESIGKRREFRLAEVDRMLFGNKIIA